jgi:hypothetical protein
MTAELVPFGKHKGQPVEVLIADGDYRDWPARTDSSRRRPPPARRQKGARRHDCRQP